ncbi:MAG: CDP-diacylglycerol--serine O-phosphatidyltransferase [Acidobacteria bacterium]|nr:CDP-diacylglycerol--serine O-phosphatidyltransferase [Acidobacteriota bacterium]
MSLHDVPTTPVPERRGLRRGVFLLPSLFTVANLFCGWACVVYAMRGEFHTAAPFIGFAVVLDMLDGRIARMTGSSSAFGVEFDSMADLISFGMAPAALTFQWGLQPLGRLGWAVGFLYLAAAAVRLARFNIQHVTDKRYFVGMPSPSAAGVPAATIFFVGDGLTERGPALLALVMLVVPALLMVSTFRFRSLKTMNLSSPVNSKVLIVVAAAIALFTTSPDVVLLVLAYGYLVSPIIEWAATRGSRKAAPAAAPALVDVPPGEAPPEAASHREL